MEIVCNRARFSLFVATSFSFSNNLSLKNKVSHYWFVANVKICAIIKLKMHHYPKVNMYLFFLKNI